MFKLHVIQAAFGDCLLIEHGSPEDPRLILIDGGPSGIYRRHLRGVLRDHAGNNRALDLVILSHVDADHITGLVDFFAELRDQAAAGEPPLIPTAALWHNSFSRALDPERTIAPRFAAVVASATALAAQGVMSHSEVALLGIEQGNSLRVMARQLAIPINEGFPDDLITPETWPEAFDFNGITLQVVGPTQANLDALREEWEAWLRANEDIITDPDPMMLANADDSIPNLSSICILAGVDDQTLLLTGDARGDFIIEGLISTGLLEEGGTLHVNVLKLPHHGSDRNLDIGFFRTVTADRYVVSADGRHGNPDYPTYTWLVEAANEAGRPIEIIATNPTESSNRLLASHPPEEWGYTLNFMPEGAHSMTVEIA